MVDGCQMAQHIMCVCVCVCDCHVCVSVSVCGCAVLCVFGCSVLCFALLTCSAFCVGTASEPGNRSVEDGDATLQRNEDVCQGLTIRVVHVSRKLLHRHELQQKHQKQTICQPPKQIRQPQGLLAGAVILIIGDRPAPSCIERAPHLTFLVASNISATDAAVPTPVVSAMETS